MEERAPEKAFERALTRVADLKGEAGRKKRDSGNKTPAEEAAGKTETYRDIGKRSDPRKPDKKRASACLKQAKDLRSDMNAVRAALIYKHQRV